MSVALSVILAAYNSEAFLEEAINSILHQTFDDFELILINDGSDDRTYEIMEGAKHKDDRIVILHNQQNLGLAASLNKGIEIARGDLLARMDADDISHKDRFAHQTYLFFQKPDLILLGTNSTQVNLDGEKIEHSHVPEDDWTIRCTCLMENPFSHPSTMMRAAPFKEHGLRYDTNFETTQDWELWTRLLTYGKAEIIPDRLLIRRIHNEAISSRKRSLQVSNSLKALQIWTEYFLGSAHWNHDRASLILDGFLSDRMSADTKGIDRIKACHAALDLLAIVEKKYTDKPHQFFQLKIIDRCIRMGLFPPIQKEAGKLAMRLISSYPTLFIKSMGKLGLQRL